LKSAKAMQAEGLDWGEGYRPLGRRAPVHHHLGDRNLAAQPQLEYPLPRLT
jgi:hypothetical protein